MVKIKLNELKSYKVIRMYEAFGESYYNEDGTEYIDGYRESRYICGFINRLYVKDSKIYFDLYAIDWEGKFKDKKIEVDISKINIYKKLIGRKKYKWENTEWSLEIEPHEIEIDESLDDLYEVITIKTDYEYDEYEFDRINFCYTDKKISRNRYIQEIDLYKDTGFEFIIDKLSYLIDCEDEISNFTNQLLTDEKISKFITVDY